MSNACPSVPSISRVPLLETSLHIVQLGVGNIKPSLPYLGGVSVREAVVSLVIAKRMTEFLSSRVPILIDLSLILEDFFDHINNVCPSNN